MHRLEGGGDFNVINHVYSNRTRVLPERERQRSPSVRPGSDVPSRRDDRRFALGEMGCHCKLPLQRLKLHVPKVARSNLRHHPRRPQVHDRVVRVLENPRALNDDPELARDAESRFDCQSLPFLGRHPPDFARAVVVAPERRANRRLALANSLANTG
ncbi:MAG: hypothetical protein M3304_12570 [Actinomycetota bacterium]|nr:hypothetical protein [Actinomycetota bacterium]